MITVNQRGKHPGPGKDKYNVSKMERSLAASSDRYRAQCGPSVSKEQVVLKSSLPLDSRVIATHSHNVVEKKPYIKEFVAYDFKYIKLKNK